MDRHKAYFVLGLTDLVGWGSLLAFLVFLFVGSLHLVNLGLDRSGVLWFDTGAFPTVLRPA